VSGSGSSVMTEIVRIGADRGPRLVGDDPPGVPHLSTPTGAVPYAQREISSPPEGWSFEGRVSGRGLAFSPGRGVAAPVA
jgi:hypothetical protein